MGRRAREKREPKAPSTSRRETRREGPNWPLLALSVVGVLLAGYLTWTESVGSALKGCTEGSGCDVVLQSRWGTLLGMPTARWGLLAYLALAGSTFIKGADRHWRTAWTLAFFGVCYSAYLTTVSLTILGATCPYCLTSFALMTSILAMLTWQRPDTATSFSWAQWLARRAPVAIGLIALLHLNYIGVLGAPPTVEDPMLRALAVHLSDSGAKMYGTSWCPHCQEQKAMFGASAKRLPYVECSTGGQNSPQTAICSNLNIRIYPTWVINGARTEEVLPIERLVALTGFHPPTAPASSSESPLP
jgi:uncharacterized membrane protein/glutaredoxin